MKSMHRKLVSAVVAAMLAGAGLSAQAAAVLLVDRGLPTANVNEDMVNPANGANRSNVAWFPGSYTSSTDYLLLGDSIKNASGQTWFITTLRMWTFEGFEVGSTQQLYGGKLGAANYGALSSGASVTSGVLYQNGDTYRDAFGSNTPLWQIDFTVDIQLDAGETLEYFFDSDVLGFDGPAGLHASNAALSGGPMQGADDLMLEARLINGSIDMSTRAPWTSNNPSLWDKASDFNVQAFGTVPEPASLALAGLALAAAASVRRRRR